jgi:hypothetical protein
MAGQARSLFQITQKLAKVTASRELLPRAAIVRQDKG